MSNKQIEIVLTDEDTDILSAIVDDEESEPVTWTYDGVDITFVGHHWKVKQLREQIRHKKQHMSVCGYGSRDTRELQSLEDELYDLVGY